MITRYSVLVQIPVPEFHPTDTEYPQHTLASEHDFCWEDAAREWAAALKAQYPQFMVHLIEEKVDRSSEEVPPTIATKRARPRKSQKD